MYADVAFNVRGQCFSGATMSWYDEVEERYRPALLEAALSANRDVQHLELDFLNGDVVITLSRRLMKDERRAIQETTEQAGHHHWPHVSDWPIRIPPPQTRTYRSHLVETPRVFRPFGNPETIVVFDVPVGHIIGMREAEQIIASNASEFRFVASFALGGISIAARQSQIEFEACRPANPIEVPAAADAFDRYHVFPGLLWSETSREAEAFLTWLEGLDSDSTVLAFDTGSSGNGVRRVFNVIENAVRQGRRIKVRHVHLLGVVDRRDEEQVVRDERLRQDGSEGLRLSLAYHHVDRMLSEDCQHFLGYASARKLGFVSPLRDAAIVRILNDEGGVQQIVASTRSANIFSALMSEPERSPPGEGGALTAEVEKAMATEILEDSWRNEKYQLHNAWAWKLINDDEYSGRCRELEHRFSAAIRDYPRLRWDFDRKQVIRNDAR
jgi:hypothetical protein